MHFGRAGVYFAGAKCVGCRREIVRLPKDHRFDPFFKKQMYLLLERKESRENASSSLENDSVVRKRSKRGKEKPAVQQSAMQQLQQRRTSGHNRSLKRI